MRAVLSLEQGLSVCVRLYSSVFDAGNTDPSEYDMAAALRRCKDERLKKEKIRERFIRISQIDPLTAQSQVAMVPIDRSVGDFFCAENTVLQMLLKHAYIAVADSVVTRNRS